MNVIFGVSLVWHNQCLKITITSFPAHEHHDQLQFPPSSGPDPHHRHNFSLCLLQIKAPQCACVNQHEKHWEPLNQKPHDHWSSPSLILIVISLSLLLHPSSNYFRLVVIVHIMIQTFWFSTFANDGQKRLIFNWGMGMSDRQWRIYDWRWNFWVLFWWQRNEVGMGIMGLVMMGLCLSWSFWVKTLKHV